MFSELGSTLEYGDEYEARWRRTISVLLVSAIVRPTLPPFSVLTSTRMIIRPPLGQAYPSDTIPSVVPFPFLDVHVQ